MPGRIIGDVALFDALAHQTEEEADAFIAVIEAMSEPESTRAFQALEDMGIAQDFVEFGIKVYLMGRRSALSSKFTGAAFLKEETHERHQSKQTLPVREGETNRGRERDNQDSGQPEGDGQSAGLEQGCSRTAGGDGGGAEGPTAQHPGSLGRDEEGRPAGEHHAEDVPGEGEDGAGD